MNVVIATTTDLEGKILQEKLDKDRRFNDLFEKILKQVGGSKSKFSEYGKYPKSTVTRKSRGESPMDAHFFKKFVTYCKNKDPKVLTRKIIEKMLELKNLSWKQINYVGKDLSEEESEKLLANPRKLKIFRSMARQKLVEELEKAFRKKPIEENSVKMDSAEKRLSLYKKAILKLRQNDFEDTLLSPDIYAEILRIAQQIDESRLKDGENEPHPSVMSIIGEAHLLRGNNKKARQIFSEVIKIVDENLGPVKLFSLTERQREQVDYRCKLAESLNNDGEYEKAKEVMDEAFLIIADLNEDKEKICFTNSLFTKETSLFKFEPIRVSALFRHLKIISSHKNFEENENLKKDFSGSLSSLKRILKSLKNLKLKTQLEILSLERFLESEEIREEMEIHEIAKNIHKKLLRKSQKADRLLNNL